jgi:hypothetical protein
MRPLTEWLWWPTQTHKHMTQQEIKTKFAESLRQLPFALASTHPAMMKVVVENVQCSSTITLALVIHFMLDQGMFENISWLEQWSNEYEAQQEQKEVVK